MQTNSNNTLRNLPPSPEVQAMTSPIDMEASRETLIADIPDAFRVLQCARRRLERTEGHDPVVEQDVFWAELHLNGLLETLHARLVRPV